MAMAPPPCLPPGLDPRRPVAAASAAASVTVGGAEAAAHGAAQEAEVRGGTEAQRPGKSMGISRHRRVFCCVSVCL